MKVINCSAKFAIQFEKKANVWLLRKLSYYNLDVIISVGYRVKSNQGIQFRQLGEYCFDVNIFFKAIP